MHRAVFMTLLKMWQASQKPTRALFLEGLSDFRSWDQTHYHLGHNRRFLQGDSVRDFALRASLFQRQRWGETDKSPCLPLYPVTLSLLLLGSFTFPQTNVNRLWSFIVDRFYPRSPREGPMCQLHGLWVGSIKRKLCCNTLSLPPNDFLP